VDGVLSALVAIALLAPNAIDPGIRASSTAAKPVHITIAASGDFLIHQPVWQQALADGHGHYDFRPMVRYVKPIVSRADVALCHVETPMSSRAPSGYPVFNTPTALAKAI
jgi:poly-gamma-glutamate synthesis protein (capsule biosynthesis protein)